MTESAAPPLKERARDLPPLDNAGRTCGASISGASPHNGPDGRFNCELQAHDILTPHRNINWGEWQWYEGARAWDGHELSNALAEIDRYPRSGASAMAKVKIVNTVRSLRDALAAANARVAELETDAARLDWMEDSQRGIELLTGDDERGEPTRQFWCVDGCSVQEFRITFREAIDAAMSASLPPTEEPGQ